MRHYLTQTVSGVLLTLILTALLACSHSTDSLPPTDNSGSDADTTDASQVIQLKQKYLFEVSYINFAWGHVHRGIYIDRNGNVYSYHYDRDDEIWQPEDYLQLTEADLTDKYSHNRTHIATVHPRTLRDMYDLVASAAQGELSERVHVMCDAGGTQYTAYLYDPAASRYMRVLLKLSGDYEQENLSGEARDLCQWLNMFWPPP